MLGPVLGTVGDEDEKDPCSTGDELCRALTEAALTEDSTREAAVGGRPCRSGQQPGEVPPVSQAAGQEVRAGGRRGQQLFSLLPAFCYTYLVIDLEIQKRGASNFLLFMAVLVIWGPLKFHMKFRVGFPISAKHVPEIWVEITLSV